MNFPIHGSIFHSYVELPEAKYVVIENHLNVGEKSNLHEILLGDVLNPQNGTFNTPCFKEMVEDVSRI